MLTRSFLASNQYQLIGHLFCRHGVAIASNLTNYALKREELNMHKLAITLVATMVLVFAGGLAWKADATTEVGGLTPLTKNYSPIEKVCVLCLPARPPSRPQVRAMAWRRLRSLLLRGDRTEPGRKRAAFKRS